MKYALLLCIGLFAPACNTVSKPVNHPHYYELQQVRQCGDGPVLYPGKCECGEEVLVWDE